MDEDEMETIDERRTELEDLQELHNWDLRFLASQGLLREWEKAEAAAYRDAVHWLESRGCLPIFPGVISFVKPLEFLVQQEKNQ